MDIKILSKIDNSLVNQVEKILKRNIQSLSGHSGFLRISNGGRQVRIQDLLKGGPASEAESCRCSKAELHEQSEPLVAGVQEAFGFLMLKYAFSYIEIINLFVQSATPTPNSSPHPQNSLHEVH